jgi:conjugative transfer region protein TrbK
MNRRQTFGIGGRVALAGALFIALFAFGLVFEENPGPLHIASVPAPPIVEGPLETELRWCRHLGDEALQDKACLKAWEENRAHFLNHAPKKSVSRPPVVR